MTLAIAVIALVIALLAYRKAMDVEERIRSQ